MKIRMLLRVGACLALGFLLAQTSAYGAAATYIWNGGTSPAWSTVANWTTAVPGAGNVAIFSQVVPPANMPAMDAAGVAKGLQFDAGAVSYTISGPNSLTVRASGIVVNSANAQTINAPLIMAAAAQNWNAASGDLTIGGTVNNGGLLLTLSQGSAAQTVALNGAISGIGGLTQSGSGTVTLAGANSYSGVTTVSAGTLNMNGASTASGAITVNGGTLNVNDAGAVNSGAQTLTLGGVMKLYTGVNSSRPLAMSAGGQLDAQNRTATFASVAVNGASTVNLVDDGAPRDLTFGGATWTAGTLTINGWSDTINRDKIFINGTASANFLANTSFTGFGATSWMVGNELAPNGVTPVPEPQAYAALMGLGALGFVAYRRRILGQA